jgi:hypothetical protein
MNIDFSKLTPCRGIRGEDAEETRDLNQMVQEARGFVASFAWCQKIAECYFGFGVGGIVAIFLFRIEPRGENVDEWLWTVVGDLPPAYLVTDIAPDAANALRVYIREMQRWVGAVKNGEPVEDLIPVNVPATLINAENLERRLRFLEQELLPKFK